jgi:iron(III) transport system permease protein
VADPVFVESVINSFLVAMTAATLGVILFALLAWVVARKRLPYTRALSLLVWLPWAVPGLLLGFAWSALILGTGLSGLIYGTLVPLISILVVKELPLGVPMLRAALGQISSELEESAVMAGAGQATILRRILLPLIAPMLGTVFVFTFMMSLRDIGATVMLATPGTRTMAILLFEYSASGVYESAAVVGILLAVSASIVTAVVLRAMRKHSISPT